MNDMNPRRFGGAIALLLLATVARGQDQTVSGNLTVSGTVTANGSGTSSYGGPLTATTLTVGAGQIRAYGYNGSPSAGVVWLDNTANNYLYNNAGTIALRAGGTDAFQATATKLSIPLTTGASSPLTGSLVNAGGFGNAGAAYFGSTGSFASDLKIDPGAGDSNFVLGGTNYEWRVMRDYAGGLGGRFKIRYTQGSLDALTIERNGSAIFGGAVASTSLTSGTVVIGTNIGLSGNSGGPSYFGGNVTASGAGTFLGGITGQTLNLTTAGNAVYENTAGAGNNVFFDNALVGASTYFRTSNASTNDKNALILGPSGNATLAGNLTVSGATASTFSGSATIANVGDQVGVLLAPTSGTKGAWYQIINSGGTLDFGLDNSTGSVFGTAGAYGTAIYRPASTAFAISRASTVDLSISATGNTTVASATASTSTTTGAFQVVGGVGIGGNINAGGVMSLTANANSLQFTPNTGTSTSYATFNNTGGSSYLGVEGSSGGGIVAGSAAYGLSLTSAVGKNLYLGTNGGAKALTLDASQNAAFGGSIRASTSTIGSWDGLGITNADLGASSRVNSWLSNGTDTLYSAVTSTGYSGTLLTGGPTGTSANIWTGTAKPLVLGTNGIAAITISSAQNATFAGTLTIASTTASISTTTGSLVVGSNVGLSGNTGGTSYFGGPVSVAGALTATSIGGSTTGLQLSSGGGSVSLSRAGAISLTPSTGNSVTSAGPFVASGSALFGEASGVAGAEVNVNGPIAGTAGILLTPANQAWRGIGYNSGQVAAYPSYFAQNDSAHSRVELLTAGAGIHPIVSGTVMGGSLASPQATPAGADFPIRLVVYDGSGFQADVAKIDLWSQGNPAGGDHRTAIRFYTTNTGGTTQEAMRIASDGSVQAQEVVVQPTNNWPDYVFASGYRLTPLSEVARAIRSDQHLPGMPSASEVHNSGLKVGQMEALLLQKVEELTLHLISQQEQLASQARKIDRLEASNSSLAAKLANLK